ncbi:hypothetical protein KM043_013389 [Ampulex compressa]|nr:hypothetical protein KM043_013389 [Ampulex compressa]
MYNMIDPEATQEYKQDISVKFFPPAYVQRYVTVSDILMDQKYHGKIRKVVDFGCAELSFLVYLKHIPDIEQILCVDIDGPLLLANSAKAMPLVAEYLHCRTRPLIVEVCEGSAVDYDKKLEKTDAVVCIELIEHLYPETLNGLTINIFERIKPKVAVITTPNADFNVLFLHSGFRHPDHKFEWTRQQFQDWANNLIVRYPSYKVTFDGICNGPNDTEHLGACTQMAIFELQTEEVIPALGTEGLFKTVALYEYPFRVDNRSDEEKILDEVVWYIRQIAYSDDDIQDEVPLKKLMEVLQKFHITMDTLRTILEVAEWSIVDRESGPAVIIPQPSTFSGSDMQDESDWDNEVEELSNNVIRSAENERYFDEWYNETWEEEPSIIIPQNNTVVQENTYLYDGENISFTTEDVIENTGTTRHIDMLHLNDDSYSDTFPQQPLSDNRDYISRRETQGTFHPDDMLDFPNQNIDCIESCADGLQDVKRETSEESVISNSNLQANTPLEITQPVSRMLDFQRYLSTSHSSTSPEPYLLHLIQSDKFFQGNIISNEEDCFNEYILNNTFCQYDLSRDENITTEETDLQNNSTKHRVIINDNNTDNCDNKDCVNSYLLHDINVEEVPGNSKDCNHDMTSPTVVDSLSCIEENKDIKVKTKFDKKQIDSNVPSVNINDYTPEAQPRFTSSPKVNIKMNAGQIERKSAICHKEVINVTTFAQPCQSHCNTEINTTNQFLQNSSTASMENKDNNKVKFPSTTKMLGLDYSEVAEALNNELVNNKYDQAHSVITTDSFEIKSGKQFFDEHQDDSEKQNNIYLLENDHQLRTLKRNDAVDIQVQELESIYFWRVTQ